MASVLNPHNNYSYTRSIFEHPSKWYDSYQENGTKYLKSRKKLDEVLQSQLNACAGEIFLSGISGETRAEQIADIASHLGEVYILRFKVNFSGDSRGFAYLQYMNPSLMELALSKLPKLFHQYSLHMIRVCESRNSSKLLLKKTHGMSPKVVFETLKSFINFDHLVGREIYQGYFEYQINFKCNEDAVHARRDLLKTITKFGRNAVIVWDNPKPIYNNTNNETSPIARLQNHNRAAQMHNTLTAVPPKVQNTLNSAAIPPICKSGRCRLNTMATGVTPMTGMRGCCCCNSIEENNLLVADVGNPWSSMYSSRSGLPCVKQDINPIAVGAVGVMHGGGGQLHSWPGQVFSPQYFNTNMF